MNISNNKTTIHFLNHSSLLINYKENYIYTDPFFQNPAFDTWLPTPPMYINPSYILAIAKATKNFYILISHGHDDHCDDKLLTLFKDFKVIISKFGSPGLKNRLTKIGFNKIIEIQEDIKKIGIFKFCSFVNKKFSLDDSVQLIKTPDLTFVHGNDCWWPMQQNHINKINKIKNKKKLLFASQIAIADGYPSAYTNFKKSEKEKISIKRISKSLISSMKNAANVKAKHFINYAGHIKIFSKNAEVNSFSGYVEKTKIDKILKKIPKKEKVNYLDMFPGDVYNGNIIKGIGRNTYKDQHIKDSSVDFWKLYGQINYPNYKIKFLDLKRKKLLNNFTETFLDYVNNSKKKFRPEILNSKIIFEIKGQCKKTIKFKNYKNNKRLDLHIKWEKDIADLILSGEINFESSYIGCLGNFSVKPNNHYNGHAIRWLSMFGYLWQNKICKSFL
jgi:hypothetical protein